MSFDVVPFALSASLANAGTVTISYPAPASGNAGAPPSQRGKGDYDTWNAKGHMLQIGQNIYQSPKHFKLTFNANASNITLTNVAMGTLPAGSTGVLQIDRPTPDSQYLRTIGAQPDKMYPVAVQLIDIGSPLALNTSGICASQSITGTASTVAALLNGTGTDVTANTDGSVTLGTPRNITAAWTNTAVMTVVGKDIFGTVMSEASASGTSMTGKKAFKTITKITVSADVTSATVGYGDVLGLPVAVANASQVLAEIRNGQKIGSANQTVRVYWSLNQVDLLAGSTNSAQIQAPISGVCSKVGTVIRKAITTGGTITFQDAATAFVGATITIANSAAQGATQVVTPTSGDASLVVAKNDVLQVIPASFATAGEVDGFIEITPTENSLMDGTFVIGDVLLATTTTGDVRGTYKPSVATNGSDSYHLLLALTDINAIGVTQK